MLSISSLSAFSLSDLVPAASLASALAFGSALAQVVIIDVLLGGDNALLIALACRDLPPAMRRKGLLWGALGAVLLRGLLLALAVSALHWPGVPLGGALLLMVIAVRLAKPEHAHQRQVPAASHLWAAIRMVLIADLVMSLDNVVGIAAVARGLHDPWQSSLLVGLGLLISVPIVVWGSEVALRILHRWPALVWAGCALLGWIAGDLLLEDSFLQTQLAEMGLPPAAWLALDRVWPVGWGLLWRLSCALLVLGLARVQQRRVPTSPAGHEAPGLPSQASQASRVSQGVDPS